MDIDLQIVSTKQTLDQLTTQAASLYASIAELNVRIKALQDNLNRLCQAKALLEGVTELP
jgi:hypothetical protein